MNGTRRFTPGRVIGGLALVALILLAMPGVAYAATYSSSTSFKVNPGVVLIGSILFAALCAWIASTKGRSVALWAVLGFFFGLISLIVLAILKKKQPTMMMNNMSAPPPPAFNPPPPAVPPMPPPDQPTQ